jgi:hypothetical protein
MTTMRIASRACRASLEPRLGCRRRSSRGLPPRQAAGRRRCGLCPCCGRRLDRGTAQSKGIRAGLLSNRTRRQNAHRDRLDDGRICDCGDRIGARGPFAAARVSEAREYPARTFSGDQYRPALRGRPPQRTAVLFVNGVIAALRIRLVTPQSRGRPRHAGRSCRIRRTFAGSCFAAT